MPDKPDFYDFDGIRLFLTDTHIEFLGTGVISSPSKIHRRFLLALAKKAPDKVDYQDLWKEVWYSDNFNESALKNIQETKRTLIKWLKVVGVENPSIVAEHGYRLDCDVTPGYLKVDTIQLPQERDITEGKTGENSETPKVDSKTKNWWELLVLQIAYIIPMGIFYGLLFLIAAIMEVAYEFNVWGNMSICWGLLLALINCVGFFAACGIIGYRLYNKRNSFLFAAGILLGATLISIFLSAQFLPFRPVTQATYQTQPAFVAFGKNALIYFLPLGIVFLLLPFYIVNAKHLVKWEILVKMPSDTISIKPRWLFTICAGAIVFSILTINYMLDNLSTGEYHMLFVGMIMLRLVVYFGLALSSSAWYYTQIKRNDE